MSPPKLDLSNLRHELRTPTNHILGYCEMLQEDDSLPEEFAPDLRKIHAGGRQLLTLIAEYFDEDNFAAKRSDLQRLCHDLRTPVNQIIGYCEMLEELAEDTGRPEVAGDLRKIGAAARSWLDLMERYLLPDGDDPETPLADVEGVAAPSLATAPTPRPRRGGHGQVLAVDDNPANLDMLSRRLSRDGYSIQIAASGEEALQRLRSTPVDLVLLDLIMPGLDGYQVLLQMKADPDLKEIPVIMLSALDQEEGIARCIEQGAEDFVSKPFSPVFLRARIDASLEKRRLREREREAFEALRATQDRLAAELTEAAVYVRSLLPPPVTKEIGIQWRFLPCAELGGDIFGYHWMDPHRLALYLLDVSGHGMGAALLSVSIFNLLRAQSLPRTDFRDPAEVLGRLNRVFPMDRHNNLLFTMWYGVYDRTRGTLTYASGGHPPAMCVDAASGEVLPLTTRGPVLGFAPEAQYQNETSPISPGTRMYLFSDGVYEIQRTDGSTAQLEDLVEQLGSPPGETHAKLDEIMRWAADISGGAAFEDDLSILEILY